MKTLLITILTGLALSVSAQVNEEAFEAEAALIRLPASISGSVILRECDKCSSHTLRVTSDTRYLVNGSPTSLQRLQDLHSSTTTSDGVFVVAYDISSGFATWIALDY